MSELKHLEAWRAYSNQKLTQLKDWLKDRDGEGLAGENMCVYATGSLGRLELSEHSDLDLFIVGDAT